MNNVSLCKIVNTEYNTVWIGSTDDDLVNNIIVPLEKYLENNPQVNDTNIWLLEYIRWQKPKFVLFFNCK